MKLIGVDYLRSCVERDQFAAKMVFNETGAIIFPVSAEHRDQKSPSISYEDDHQGNALAAMLTAGRIEVRFHRQFSDERVASLVRQMLATPDLAIANGWHVTYQGRKIDAA